MPTIEAILKGALQEIGIVPAGGSLEPSEGDDALLIFNDFIDALGTERLSMFTVLRTTKVLAASTASYTIGTGGDINIVRPVYIDDARLILDNTASTPNEVKIDNLDPAEYAAVPQKTQESSRPTAIYYDHNWSSGLGRIYPLPIPNVATTTLVLYTPSEPIAQVSSLSTSVTFPPGIRRMLRKNLALELAPSYPGCTVPKLLVQQAIESKAQFKHTNVRPIPLGCDPSLVHAPGGQWDIETDTWKR